MPERDAEVATWGLDSVWRWRLLAVRQVPEQRDKVDAVVHFIEMGFQRLAGMINAKDAGAAMQVTA